MSGSDGVTGAGADSFVSQLGAANREWFQGQEPVVQDTLRNEYIRSSLRLTNPFRHESASGGEVSPDELVENHKTSVGQG